MGSRRLRGEGPGPGLECLLCRGGTGSTARVLRLAAVGLCRRVGARGFDTAHHVERLAGVSSVGAVWAVPVEALRAGDLQLRRQGPGGRAAAGATLEARSGPREREPGRCSRAALRHEVLPPAGQGEGAGYCGAPDRRLSQATAGAD